MSPNSRQFGFAYSFLMYQEAERLKTFEGWPSKAVTPEDLASNGFFFTGEEDIARCKFCGIEVGQWKEGDSVENDHKRYNPNCYIVRGIPCGNVALGSSPSETPSRSPHGYDTCGHGNMLRLFSVPEIYSVAQTPIQDLELLGVSQTSGPENMEFISESARLRSFVNWPGSCPARPDDLAKAGFYSTGNNDQVVCFHCGGGLRDWAMGDEPWVEHARWFSKCAFVNMTKGREFVTRAGQAKPPVLPTEVMNELLQKVQDMEVCEENPSEDIAGARISGEPAAASVEPAAASEDPGAACQGSSLSETCLGGEKTVEDMELCLICYNNKRTIVFLPCGHFVSCAACASSFTNCAVCRHPLKATVRAYLS